MRSRIVTVTVPLLCQCFCLALDAKRPHRQSALLPSSRRLKLTVESEGGGWGGGAGGMEGGVGKGCAVLNTLNFRLRCGMCGDQKSPFVSRSQAGYVLEVERCGALLRSYFVDNDSSRIKKEISERKHNFQVRRSMSNLDGQIIPQKKPRGC